MDVPKKPQNSVAQRRSELISLSRCSLELAVAWVPLLHMHSQRSGFLPYCSAIGTVVSSSPLQPINTKSKLQSEEREKRGGKKQAISFRSVSPRGGSHASVCPSRAAAWSHDSPCCKGGWEMWFVVRQPCAELKLQGMGDRVIFLIPKERRE